MRHNELVLSNTSSSQGIKNESILALGYWFSTGVNLVLRGCSVMSGEVFGHHSFGGGSSWHLVSRGQGCG